MDPICRVCGTKASTVSIFETHRGIQYSVKIMKCVNINIAEEDDLPKFICENCIGELSIAYEFVLKCETTDRELRQLTLELSIEEDYKIKPELNIKEEYVPCDRDNQESFDSQMLLDDISNSDFDLCISDEYVTKQEYLHIIEQSTDEGYVSNKKNVKGRKKKVKRTNSAQLLQCVICGQTTISRSAMEVHMRTHTGEKPFTCKECLSTFRTKGSLKRHIESRHSERERKFTCETCGNSFYRKNDIVIHMRMHTNEKPYTCPHCPNTFRQVSSLIRHKRLHTGEKPFPCPICGKKFSDKSEVKKHQSVHSEEKKYTCQLCNKSVKTKNALNSHLILHSNEKQFVCSFCGMAFAFKGNLQTHIRRVHSEKSGQCSVCLKTFSNLEVHMRKHTGERPFHCKLCEKCFATKRSLTHHIAFKHENAAKFKCSIGECAKTFPTAMMLEFHLLKQHTNNTPYVCQHCSRGFYRTSDLSRHLRVSHLDINLKMPLKSENLKIIL